MGDFNQQKQRVKGNQYNAAGSINKYQGPHYQSDGNIYINQPFEREPKSAGEIFALILLTILAIVLLFGGGALGLYGIVGAFGTVEIIQGVPRIVLGIVGVIMFFIGFAIYACLAIKYPQYYINNGRRRW